MEDTQTELTPEEKIAAAVAPKPEALFRNVKGRKLKTKLEVETKARYKNKPEPVAELNNGLTEAGQIAESRKALEHPLEKGQKFFESPEGFIVVGEASQEDVWCRKANGGKGMRINARR